MSLFQYGFRPAVATQETHNQTGAPAPVPGHIPEHVESGLNLEEHTSVLAAVSDLSNPAISSNKRKPRGKYSEEARARIGRYALVGMLVRMAMKGLGNISLVNILSSLRVL